jgi:hypothetical protein
MKKEHCCVCVGHRMDYFCYNYIWGYISGDITVENGQQNEFVTELRKIINKL